MKNLFYKEMVLSMHPVVWVFIVLFPFLILIPNYPLFISYIYICSAYPILFLGANKGQQSNDIVYSCLLPVRKEDVVKARLMTVLFMQVLTTVIVLALTPLAGVIRSMSGEQFSAGIGLNGILTSTAFSLLGFVFYDLIYFMFFYSNGRSVLAPTLIGILVYCIIEAFAQIALPYLVPDFMNALNKLHWGYQMIFLLLALIISLVCHYLILKLATAKLEKVDL